MIVITFFITIELLMVQSYFDTNNPVYDPAEEEFRRRMQRKKKKRGPRL
jgi:hypothetical protein